MLLAGLSIRGIRRRSRGLRRRRRISTTVVAALDDLVRFGPRRGRFVPRPRIALAAVGLVRGLLGLGVHRRGRPLPFRAATVAAAAVRGDEGGVEGGFVHLDPPRRRPLRPSCIRRGTRDDIARRGGRYCRRDDDDDDDANERLPAAPPTPWRSSSTSDDLLDRDDDVIFRHMILRVFLPAK